ncbi:MAG: hypothetical protein ACTTJ3_01470, partial [Treponema sp.]
MGLKTEKTNWIFLLTSQDEPELRHVDDVGFGIDSLIRSGIAIEDITIIIDSSKQTTLQVIRKKEGFDNKTVYKSSELKELFKKNSHDNIVLFVNGHGNYHGLDSTPIITPFDLLDCLQNANNLKYGVVFLGQCFAGIFNYMPVMKREKNGKQLPPLVVVGSAGLNLSVSSTRVVQEKTKKPYQANIFLYYLFKWIEKPEDIDGDGNYSLIDAYKYVSYCVIEFCHHQKITNLLKRKGYKNIIYEETKKLENKTISDNEKKLINNKIMSIKRQLLLYDHPQEPWIL